jgi:outer membrane protein assembly factor BamA
MDYGVAQLAGIGPRKKAKKVYTNPDVAGVNDATNTIKFRGKVEQVDAAGKKLTVFDLQEKADRLRDELRAQGYIEAEASARLEDDVAVFRVRPGPRFAWRVEGMADPPALSREIHEALFEGEALDKGRTRILQELRTRGYLRAAVKARVEAGGTGEPHTTSMRDQKRRNGRRMAAPSPATRLLAQLPAAMASDALTLTRRIERAPALSPYFESSVPGLYFVGPVTPVLPQAMYTFRGDSVTLERLFIVPVGQDGEATEYEAVFT